MKINEEKTELLHLMDRVCHKSTSDALLDPVIISEVESLLGSDRKNKLDLLRQCFEKSDERAKSREKKDQFNMIEEFIREEQETGRHRRNEARKLTMTEEKRLAAEIASLKSLQEVSAANTRLHELQDKITNAERSYMSRKLVVAKAAASAGSECRFQFSRSRVFMEELHKKRQQELFREYKSSLFHMQIVNHIQQKDSRVCALEEQVAQRLYEKKKADANEYYMAQCIEEAQYLESVLGLLDKVQSGKEEAARCLLALQVKQLKNAAASASDRKKELELFYASSKLEIAKMTASCFDAEEEEQEMEISRQTMVDNLERLKDFKDNNAVLSISQLYDEVLWSVATTNLGLSSSGSNTYSDWSSHLDRCELSDSEEEEDDDAKEKEPQNNDRWTGEVVKPGRGGDDLWDHTHMDEEKPSRKLLPSLFRDDDAASACTETTFGGEGCGSTTRGSTGQRSPVGNMQMSQLMRDIRAREKSLLKKHKAQVKKEKRAYRSVIRALKAKHQDIIVDLLEKSLAERHALREGIKQRLDEISKRQLMTTNEVKESIGKDRQILKQALFTEDKRLTETKEESFADAQNLISAQVFHEVRNALSSVIAMSEITTTLKNDPSVSPEMFASSVDDMLCQLSEVVSYATSVLNNILDLRKIKSSTMVLHKEEFDLQELVGKATTMQFAKAVRAKMTFIRSPEACIANTDKDIVLRILTNLISNAVKFTVDGAVQPFVWPLEDIRSGTVLDTNGKACQQKSDQGNTRLVALGVADTGPGISAEMVRLAKIGVVDSAAGGTTSHGAKNSGFGLYLCQLLAQSLGTSLHLASLHDVWNLLSEETKQIVMARNRRAKKGSACAKQYQGTVLFFVLPAYVNTPDFTASFHAKCSKLEIDRSLVNGIQQRVVFRPRPAPSSRNGTFRVLVADDVLMLRKGMVHTISAVFAGCPLSICTACSAEDMLRAVETNPYDLIISDNLFHHDPAHLRPLLSHQEESFGRPAIVIDPTETSRSETRALMTDFFQNESFSVREGDGDLLGVDAIAGLLHDWKGDFPMPLMMLLSGHKIDLPESYGIIVTRKPLKQSDLKSLLQAACPILLERGHCINTYDSLSDETPSESSGSENSTTPILNRHGAQIFEQIGVCASGTCVTEDRERFEPEG